MSRVYKEAVESKCSADQNSVIMKGNKPVPILETGVGFDMGEIGYCIMELRLGSYCTYKI